MLKVTIELCPFGRESDKKTLHTVYIANRGHADKDAYGDCCPELCKYEVWKDYDPREKKRPHSGAWTLHDRRDGALYLSAMAILDLLGLDYSIGPFGKAQFELNRPGLSIEGAKKALKGKRV